MGATFGCFPVAFFRGLWISPRFCPAPPQAAATLPDRYVTVALPLPLSPLGADVEWTGCPSFRSFPTCGSSSAAPGLDTGPMGGMDWKSEVPPGRWALRRACETNRRDVGSFRNAPLLSHDRGGHSRTIRGSARGGGLRSIPRQHPDRSPPLPTGHRPDRSLRSNPWGSPLCPDGGFPSNPKDRGVPPFSPLGLRLPHPRGAWPVETIPFGTCCSTTPEAKHERTRPRDETRQD